MFRYAGNWQTFKLEIVTIYVDAVSVLYLDVFDHQPKAARLTL